MKNNFTYRLYGRSKGRKKNFLLDTLTATLNLKKIDHSKYNIIDIGCGYGESTIDLACANKKNIVIACEKYLDGVNNIINEVKKNSINNVFIYKGNVNQLIDELCYENSISEIWILFPDPWPKKKHFKRRLINKVFFNKLSLITKKDAKIHIATDSCLYLSEILWCVYELQDQFLWINQNKDDWDYEEQSLPKTKYYKKALKNGLKPFYINLVKL